MESSKSQMRLVVAGAAGRMGRMLVQAIHASEGAVLAGALERPGSSALGLDAGELAGVGACGVLVSDDPLNVLAKADGLIDFTTPDTTIALAGIAAQARIVHVIGTTGMGEAHLAALEAAERHAVIVRSGNMSLGVNLLAGLVRKVAAFRWPSNRCARAMATPAPGARATSALRRCAAARWWAITTPFLQDRANG